MNLTITIDATLVKLKRRAIDVVRSEIAEINNQLTSGVSPSDVQTSTALEDATLTLFAMSYSVHAISQMFSCQRFTEEVVISILRNNIGRYLSTFLQGAKND